MVSWSPRRRPTRWAFGIVAVAMAGTVLTTSGALVSAHLRAQPPVHPTSSTTGPTSTTAPTTSTTAPATTTTSGPTTTTAPPRRSTVAPPPTTTTLPAFTILGALPPGRPLSGKVIGIDPGHNGLNYTDPSYLDQQIWNGREYENCDTTGTETAGGYTEAQFNFNVATDLAADLESEGAGVVLTRSTNSGIGPCVDQRANILDAAQSSVAIDIHADGGPTSGRGFAILLPVADGVNDAVIGSSQAFGVDVRSSFSATGMPVSTYDGTDGFSYRSDLAGLNLTTVPKVLIECGNMQNTTDAAMLSSAAFQQDAAVALADAITTFLS